MPKIKESMQILFDVLNDPNTPEENKYILFRQGFISGALAVLYIQKNIDGETEKEVIDAIAQDLNISSIDHYEKFVDAVRNKKKLNKVNKLLKSFQENS